MSDADCEIFELTDIIELGPCCGSKDQDLACVPADDVIMKGQLHPGSSSANAFSSALPVSDIEADSSGMPVSINLPEKSAAVKGMPGSEIVVGGVEKMPDGTDAIGMLLRGGNVDAYDEHEEQASLEHRLAVAEQTIMILCKEIGKMHQQLASLHSFRDDFFERASLLIDKKKSSEALLSEHASNMITTTASRVDGLEHRMSELENVSMRSAAEIAARLIRDEIDSIKRGL